MFVDFGCAPRATLGIAGGLMVDGELEVQKTQVMIAAVLVVCQGVIGRLASSAC